jgi:hypothetical protein
MENHFVPSFEIEVSKYHFLTLAAGDFCMAKIIYGFVQHEQSAKASIKSDSILRINEIYHCLGYEVSEKQMIFAAPQFIRSIAAFPFDFTFFKFSRSSRLSSNTALITREMRTSFL